MPPRRRRIKNASRVKLTSATLEVEKARPTWPKVPTSKEFNTKLTSDGAETDQHRRARVLKRVEGRRKNFDRGVTGKTERVGGQGIGGLHGVETGELAMFEDQGDDRPPKYGEPERRWDAQEKYQSQ